MWRWQRKNVPKKIELWTHFLCASLIIHALLIFGLFSSGLRQAEHLMLTMRKPGSTAPVTLKSYTASTQSSKTTVSRAAAQKVKPKAPLKPSPPTKMAAIKPAPQAAKKAVKIEPPKPKPVAKSPEKKVAKKDIQQPPAPPKKETNPSTQNSPSKDNFDNDTSIPSTQEFSPQENFDAQLYTAVSRHWAPPAGIAPDCSCDITVSIGHDGSILKVEISKKSGILMYDLAARKAAMITTFPGWAYGKTVTIRFVQ
jgi:outer membrane biosynthesis protein TonB